MCRLAVRAPRAARSSVRGLGRGARTRALGISGAALGDARGARVAVALARLHARVCLLLGGCVSAPLRGAHPYGRVPAHRVPSGRSGGAVSAGCASALLVHGHRAGAARLPGQRGAHGGAPGSGHLRAPLHQHHQDRVAAVAAEGARQLETLPGVPARGAGGPAGEVCGQTAAGAGRITPGGIEGRYSGI